MTRTADRDTQFQEFVRARRAALLRIATLLCSGDRHRAEDLVQIALTRLYTAWPRARRTDVDAYVRRILVNALIDERRRPFARRELPLAEPPEPVPRIAAHDDDEDDDSALRAALATLPAGMRAAVVLRHVEGLSVEETAAAMRCSTGNVKSQTARGLDKLRAALAEPARTTD